MPTKRLSVIVTTIICTLVFSGFQPGPKAYAQDADDAVAEAYYLSVLESQGDGAALYSRLHPHAKNIIPEAAVVGWYQDEFFPTKPQPISEILYVEFVTWTWGVTGKSYNDVAEITFIQPFGTGTSQYAVTETVRLKKTQRGDWAWFFGRSPEFVDEQIAKYEKEVPATRTQRNKRTTTQSNQNCTLVELRPGYPEYRGLVTGINVPNRGLGDWECLEYMQKQYPEFDKRRQDRMNQEAANRLGITGTQDVWLWENWMAVEAERNLPVQCYTCLIYDETIVARTPSVRMDSNDPRLLVGLASSRDAIELFLPTAQLRGNFIDNSHFKAYAFLLSGPSSNAQDILARYDWLAEDGNFVLLDFDWVSSHLYEVGGYSWVSPRAYGADQHSFYLWGLIAGTNSLIPPAREAVISQFETAYLEWRSHGSQESLAHFVHQRIY